MIITHSRVVNFYNEAFRMFSESWPLTSNFTSAVLIRAGKCRRDVCLIFLIHCHYELKIQTWRTNSTFTITSVIWICTEYFNLNVIPLVGLTCKFGLVFMDNKIVAFVRWLLTKIKNFRRGPWHFAVYMQFVQGQRHTFIKVNSALTIRYK